MRVMASNFGARQGIFEARADTPPFGVVMHDDARLVGRELVHDRAGRVRAAVVDQEDLEIVEQLARERQHAADGIGDLVLLVQRRNDDRKPFCRLEGRLSDTAAVGRLLFTVGTRATTLSHLGGENNAALAGSPAAIESRVSECVFRATNRKNRRDWCRRCQKRGAAVRHGLPRFRPAARRCKVPVDPFDEAALDQSVGSCPEQFWNLPVRRSRKRGIPFRPVNEAEQDAPAKPICTRRQRRKHRP